MDINPHLQYLMTHDTRVSTIAIKNGTAYLKVVPSEAVIQMDSHTINGTSMEPLDFFLGIEQIIKAMHGASPPRPHDPSVINLTPYILIIDSKGEKTTIPYTNHAIFHRKDEKIWKSGDNWPVTPENADKTFIVTEDVGMWLTRPENAHEWKGRVVGPVNLESYVLRNGPNSDKPKTIEVTGEWVMYKDFTPPLRKVVFEPDQSVSPFSIIN